MNKKIIDNVELITFPEKGDEKGLLVVIEGNKELPFNINRIFYIYQTDTDIVRGKHANKKSKFLLVSISGTCKVLVDNGKEKDIVNLDKPNIGLFLNNMVWKDMYDFSQDCVLLVLSNEKYNTEEYINDYQEFLKLVG